MKLIGGIYTFCGNRVNMQYAICIIDLEDMDANGGEDLHQGSSLSRPKAIGL